MIESKEHTLDPKEISELIKDGVELSDSGNHMYVMRFGWNNDWNKAADPAPFKIKSHLNEKLRQDALGMPWVVPPYGVNMHLRKREDVKEPESIEQQLEAILKVQSDYAIGEIQGSLEYETGNVWLIIDVWPEFQAGVERGYYPGLVSPTFNFIKNTDDGVEEAQFLNLQSVPNSGYNPKFTEIQSVCKNGIKECMSEMKIHGSAGTIRSDYHKKPFSSILKGVVGAMSNEGNSTPSLEVVAKDLDATKQEVLSLRQTVGGIETQVKAIATKVGVETKEPPESGNPPTGEVAGASSTVTKEQYEKLLKENTENKTKLGEISKDFAGYKKDKEVSDKKLKEAHVVSILERKLRGKTVTEDEKTKLTEEYMKKDIDVLETIDNELKAVIPDTTSESGISGAYGLYKPDTKLDTSDRPKNSEMIA